MELTGRIVTSRLPLVMPDSPAYFPVFPSLKPFPSSTRSKSFIGSSVVRRGHGWATRVDKIFRRGQLLSAAAFSLGHGGNDAQKTMGIITAVLTAGNIWGMHYGPDGSLPHIPIEVVLSAHAAIALGTLSGGWRIVRTMGTRITKLKPVGGFCAESAAALTLAYVTLTGTPVSTTHTITGSIVGVGATRRLSAVKWGVAGRIVWAWILTIPAAAFVAAVSFWVVSYLHRLFS